MTFNDADRSSAYNEGLLQIQRLHFLWIEANNYSRKGNYAQWRWTLDAIWRELSRDALKNTGKKISPDDIIEAEEKNKWFKQYKVIEKQISEAITNKQQRNIYESISSMEIFLRALQDAVGKGGKYKSHADDDMD